MAKHELYGNVDIQLALTRYPVVTGRFILQDKAVICPYIAANQVLIVTNTCLAKLYLRDLQALFSDKQCDVVILDDGEQFKNRDSLWQIYDALANNRHHRDTTIVALGGGVVGDMAGFAAATYQRGVRLLQIPTTLLAQVDASVGGKTGINHPAGKNLIGSFYQPHAVFIDLNTLQTLSVRHFRAGLAEIIKYAILVGGEFLQQVRSFLVGWSKTENVQIFLQQSDDLADIVKQCCQIKANFVQQDEHENGVRALLNLGHTVGHALESYTQYEQWLHGEAVAIGLYVAAELSKQLGLIDTAIVNSIDELLVLAGLPNRIPGNFCLLRLRSLMDSDKKIKNGELRFILIKAIGDCCLVNNVAEEALQSALNAAVERG